MPFGVLSGVGRRMGVLDGGGDRRRLVAVFGVNVGRPIITNGDGDALFPNYFGGACLGLNLYVTVVTPLDTVGNCKLLQTANSKVFESHRLNSIKTFKNEYQRTLGTNCAMTLTSPSVEAENSTNTATLKLN